MIRKITLINSFQRTVFTRCSSSVGLDIYLMIQNRSDVLLTTRDKLKRAKSALWSCLSSRILQASLHVSHALIGRKFRRASSRLHLAVWRSHDFMREHVRTITFFSRFYVSFWSLDIVCVSHENQTPPILDMDLRRHGICAELASAWDTTIRTNKKPLTWGIAPCIGQRFILRYLSLRVSHLVNWYNDGRVEGAGMQSQQPDILGRFIERWILISIHRESVVWNLSINFR